MTYILNIETTTKSCSVVLSLKNEIVAVKESQSNYTHSENITLFISDVIGQASLTLNAIDAVAISKGPGSYMGLRIGVSTAKGLCYALNKPLIAVDTLKAMALKSAKTEADENALYCPMIDARRMEVYCALFNSKGDYLMPTAAHIINESSFEKELADNKIYFFGDGASKCMAVFKNQNHAHLIENYVMSADAMVPLAYEHFENKQFEDLAYFEPFYLKDFIPGAAKIKGLR